MRRFCSGMLQAAFAVGTALLVVASVQPADAAAKVCRQLEAELAAAGRSGNGAGLARKYDKAIATQQAQLSAARARYRNASCGFGFLSPDLCKPLDAKIDAMEANLAKMQSKRVQIGGGKSSGTRGRASILADLSENNCRDNPVVARKSLPEDDADRDLFARLFGGGIEGKTTDGQGGATVTRILNSDGEITVLGPEGRYATMCVRTCDGYYFPMSPNSSAGEFDRDQKNCESTCPGTDVQLYYRPAGDEESSTMLSASTGKPYSALGSAYVYKDISKPREQSCGCGGAAANPNFSVIGDGNGVPPPQAESQPDVAAASPPVDPLPPPGERKVRVVGPAFLPDPAGAIDLKALAQKANQ